LEEVEQELLILLDLVKEHQDLLLYFQQLHQQQVVVEVEVYHLHQLLVEVVKQEDQEVEQLITILQQILQVQEQEIVLQ
jgi:hypothetical protein